MNETEKKYLNKYNNYIYPSWQREKIDQFIMEAEQEYYKTNAKMALYNLINKLKTEFSIRRKI